MNDKPRPKSLPRQVAWSLTRILVMLGLVFVTGCYLIAQPGMRSNDPSSKTTDPDRLRGHVTMLSETFHPRDWQNPANLDKCADYIAEQLRQTGAAVELQDYKAEGNSYRNVIGRFGVGKERKIIVGAHYDSCGDTPGADDNASAVAGLIELARLIGEEPPDAEIELVAYTLEEPPFFAGPQMGSVIHAAGVADEKPRIVGVIVLEMIGYFSDEPGSQSYPHPILKVFYPNRGDFITVVGRWDQGGWIRKLKAGMKGATGLPVYSFRGPESLPGVDFSDHRSYWPHGIPAAMVTNTAFYRNTAYHTPNDTADRLDYKRMGMVVVAVDAAIRRIAR
jgi:Zn-dependent M28 family amino/carboxypeptidase